MFFGNEKINRKSCSEEKKVRGKIVYFYGLESGLCNARRKLFRVARRFIGRRTGFRKIFGGFYNFFGKFSQKFFAIFFDFCDFPTIFPKIFPKILAHNPLRFNRGLAIIVSLQVSLQVGLYLSLHLYL